ncbi:MAG: bifunctional DNA primase/polymerase [Anaerolineae bacterium]
MLGHSIEHSIPHNIAIRQVNLSSNLETQVNVTVSNSFGNHFTQQQALELYDLGLNVFPQPYGKKAGLPWKQLQYTRLHAAHPVAGVKALFQGKRNIAVMCGRTSGNLFVIDCETPQALHNHTSELQKRQIPLWIVETARGGHIYLQCTDGEVASIESGIMQDAELRGCRGYVLTSGSIHPTGAVYRWLKREGDAIPKVSAKTINWLTDKNGKPLRLRLTTGSRASTPFNPLSRSTQDYLTNGGSISAGSRNNRLFSAACDLAGNDCDQHEAEQKLTAIAEQSGLHRSEVYATIRSAYSRERKPARPVYQPAKKERPEHWKAALTFAETHEWQGRTGTSDKLILLALIERAKTGTNENGVFRASTREISVLSRTNINTTQKALKRLRDAKYIFYAGQDKTSQASLWRFSNLLIREGEKLKCESSPAVPPWISFSDSIFNSTDVMERGALGYSGLFIYKAMLSLAEAMMPSALAAALGLAVHRVNYALRKLVTYGLVAREPAGWRALAFTDAQLDEKVARPAGKLGRGQARRQRYAEQRAVYVGHIILRACIQMFGVQFLERSEDIEQIFDGDSCSTADSSVIVDEASADKEASLKLWKCPNCGQVHFAEEPPDMCDFCRDFTTWKPLADAEIDPAVETDAEALSDPLVLLALELGAEVYIIEDGKRRLIASSRSKPQD